MEKEKEQQDLIFEPPKEEQEDQIILWHSELEQLEEALVNLAAKLKATA
jgi:hypothetical protein